MDMKLNVWIHCRITNESERYLLEYQKDKILEFLDDMNVCIIGISQEVNAGSDSHSRALDSIRTHARRGDIDAVVVSDKTRLLVSEERYQEFNLFCNMFHVQIIDLQETENFLQNYILHIH